MPRTRYSPRQLDGVEVLVGAESNLSATVTNSESAVLATFTVPANSLGPNGYLKWEALCTYPNSSTSKTFRVYVSDGTITEMVTAKSGTTSATNRWFYRLVNRNATNVQVTAGPTASSASEYSDSSNPAVTYGLDTTKQLTVTVRVYTTGTALTMTYVYFQLFFCYKS